jgi:molecular chaperone DnaJ
MDQDPYSALGVAPGASADEIARAYRALAKRYHPDLNPGDPEAERAMRRVNAAYAALKDGSAEGSAASSPGAAAADPWGAAGFGAAGFGAANFTLVRSLLSVGAYFQALSLLAAFPARGAEWHFCAAVAYAGSGDRDSARRLARIAVGLAPADPEYRSLLDRLEAAAAAPSAPAGSSWLGGIARVAFAVILLNMFLSLFVRFL